jgi:molybdate transport system substrate-binding protein
VAKLTLLSGGAAQGLLAQLEDRFAAESGFAIEGSFGAVGAMKDKLLAGEPCDLVILTQALVEELASQGHVAQGSATPLGRVKTGLAVKSGAPMPKIASAADLQRSLLAAKGIYFPDPVKATAGIHFMKVLKSLGIDAQLAARLRPYPSGAVAMREMASCAETGLLGCTQVTEILYATGVELVGMLPVEFELATVYTAGVSSRARQAAAAAKLARLLVSADAAAARITCGFEPM